MQQLLKLRLPLLGGIFLVLAGLYLAADRASADTAAPARAVRMLEVKITNLTRAQNFSPPVLATHNGNASIFEPGAAASPELADVAENGSNAALAALLMGSPDVFEVMAATTGIAPGATETYTISGDGQHRFLSAVGMLVSSNDSFFGLNSVSCAPCTGTKTFFVPAYDSGTEFNSEDCAFVPGPPCGAGPVHDPQPAEGYIYVSNGIHGIGGVPDDLYDWHNPVARVTVTFL